MDRHTHCNEKCNKYPHKANYGRGDIFRGSGVPHHNYKGVDGDGLRNTKMSQLVVYLLHLLIHAQEWPMQILSPQAVPQFLRQINQ